ncbi:NAD-dependent epimerase/dehydratase family protein [Dyella sp.]|uniref:NAD-dependent epimerase/dehydratase family protein n=1 Tax=Dyella sp. TaxID=1869338 RepID=UPI0032176388
MRDSILILGAGGFIGRHLTHALLDAGHAVLAATGHAEASLHPSVQMLNLASLDDFKAALARVRTVIHTASSSTPGSSSGQPLKELQNLAPTLTLLEALHQEPSVRLIYISSGGTLYTNHDRAPATEKARIWPRSYHGAGKIAAESFIEAWCSQQASSATVIRPSNVYGPGQALRVGFGVIPNGFAKLKRDEAMEIWGDGSATRDYLYIDDFVDLCQRILREPATPGFEIVNASSGVGTSLNQLLRHMELVAGAPLKRVYHERRSLDAEHVVIDAAHAERRFGWKAATPLPQGLEQTWNWLKPRLP